MLLSESACRLGGVPVQKGEDYVAEIYSRDFGGYYYVYDRTNQIKIFEIEEMGDFYFVSETARELLNIKRVTKRLLNSVYLVAVVGGKLSMISQA